MDTQTLIIDNNLVIINLDEVNNRLENKPLKSTISQILGKLTKKSIKITIISSARKKVEINQKVTELGWSHFFSEDDIFCKENIKNYRKPIDLLELIIDEFDADPAKVALLDVFPHGLEDAKEMEMNYYSFANSALDREKIENYAKAKQTPIEIIDLY